MTIDIAEIEGVVRSIDPMEFQSLTTTEADLEAAFIGRFLLASVELTDDDIDRIWKTLPTKIRVDERARELANRAVESAQSDPR
jgi:hypothetical protein